MFGSKKPKTIALFSYSEALVKALSKYIKNLVPDLNIMNYSGTDLKFAIEGMLKNPPDILLLGVLLNDKEMDLIGKGNISPEKLDYVAKKIAPVISKFRKISSKTKIIGFDNSVFTSIYLESGADYFISCRILERQFLNTLIKVIKKERLSPEDKNIVYEKKEFYDSVVDIFDERSKITADTDKEIKFLTKELNKYGCRKVLDAGCGNGRLSIPLTESGVHMFNITGILFFVLWISSIIGLASVVMMVNVCVISPVSESLQLSHRPAKTNGSPLFSLMYQGIFLPLTSCHSKKPPAMTRQRPVPRGSLKEGFSCNVSALAL